MSSRTTKRETMARNNLIRAAKLAARQRPKLLEKSRTEFNAQHEAAEPLFSGMRVTRPSNGPRPALHRIDGGEHTIKRTVGTPSKDSTTESLEFFGQSFGSILFTKRGLIVATHPFDQPTMELLTPDEAASRFLGPHEVGLCSFDEKLGVPIPHGDNFVVRAPFAYFSEGGQRLLRRHISETITAVLSVQQ